PFASRPGRHRRPRPLPPGRRAGNPELAHQPLDRAPRHLDILPAQLAPDFPRTVNTTSFLFPDAHDLLFQFLVTGIACRRVFLSLLRRVISGRRNLQDRAGRLDPEPVLMRIDELDERGYRG